MPESGLLLLFGASFLVGLSGAAAPGPLLALSIRESARHGFSAGPSIATGHSALELVVVVLLALGLEPYLQVEGVAATIGLVGGAVLLWMAWSIGHHPQRGAPSLQRREPIPASRPRGPVVGGVVVSLSNPFWFVWWMTVGAALMARSYEWGLVGVGAFYVGHILADYSWYGLVSFIVASGRRWMTPAVYGAVMLACAAFLAAMGVYFLGSGVRTLV
jgi:threonine/homoserine/homoserine lactone efflux protein